MDTLNKILTILNTEGNDAANAYVKTITDKFSEIGLTNLLMRLKELIMLSAIPESVKEKVLEYNGYSYEQGSKGDLKELRIDEVFSDDKNNRFHVIARIIPTEVTVMGGTDRENMNTYIDIQDIEYFIKYGEK